MSRKRAFTLGETLKGFPYFGTQRRVRTFGAGLSTAPLEGEANGEIAQIELGLANAGKIGFHSGPKFSPDKGAQVKGGRDLGKIVKRYSCN